MSLIPDMSRHSGRRAIQGRSFGIAVLVLLLVPRFGFGADYPLIRYTIASRDALYRQQQQDVEAWYAQKDDIPPLMIYRYKPRVSEDLFSVAAAFNLPYDALATLNGLDAPGLLSPGEEILVPNAPGLFVPENPQGTWERRLKDSVRKNNRYTVQIGLPGSGVRSLYYYPGEFFSPDERRHFLGSLFAAPLDDMKLTSPYGYRVSPLTGHSSFHPGIDLRASTGTPVKAARDGVVAGVGTLELYGLFVILNHDGGYQSVYAHLDEILVQEGESIEAGDIVALSGNSGISTGPHLHFEIRRNGKPADPARITSFSD